MISINELIIVETGLVMSEIRISDISEYSFVYNLRPRAAYMH